MYFLKTVLFCVVVFLQLCRKVVGFISFKRWVKFDFSVIIRLLFIVSLPTILVCEA